MTRNAKKVPFDPKVFLATVNGGRSIAKYRMNQTVFSQGQTFALQQATSALPPKADIDWRDWNVR
jgi:hypothetical protein